MVGDSRSREAHTERTIERFARHYTPAVLMLALVVATLPPALHWTAWSVAAYHGMLVLLVACPCALVISTPVTLASALASAAREGVLVKGGAFLEEAARIRSVALVRAGILTRGRPEVARTVELTAASTAEVGRWLDERDEEGQFYELTPRRAGPNELGRQVADLARAGWTVEPRGATLVGLCDGPRRDSAEFVTELRRRGVQRVVLLTEAPAEAARLSGEAAGVDEIHSELSAEEKAERVAELDRTCGPVAMLGTVAGDAPALGRAALGISLGLGGADLARESADVISLSMAPSAVLFLMDHGRRTLNVIRQNIAVAIALKLLFLVAAALGAATLWMAVAADMGATLIVTLNGLRMLRPATGTLPRKSPPQARR
jgi:Cd2+/Zn2+-exporting ATPase